MRVTPENCLASDDGGPATALHLVRPDMLESWKAGPGGVWIAAAGFAAKAGEALLLPEEQGGVALVGLGAEAELGPWSLAAAAERLPAGRYRCVEAPAGLELAALGWALAHYRFDRYRSAPDAVRQHVLLLPEALDLADVLRQVRAICRVRDLVNLPAADLGPAALAQVCEQVAQVHGARFEQIAGAALLERNYPAIHAVGRAASDAPRLIDLRWGDASHPRLTLVGKGVCFDSGGLDLKTASGMALMKKDMGGGAHALALAEMVMDAHLPVCLRVLIPAVENAVAGNAMRPGDILRTRAGLSVEIGNTDAEGRLILCDALAEADSEAPDLLIDFATLTGAARVALGPDVPALFTPDDALAQALAEAAQARQDPLWRLPLWQPYADYLKSPVADINNAGDSGFAGAITAALFLKRFVTRTPRWAHLDLYAWTAPARPGRPKGGEAMTLRALWALLRARYPVI